MAGISVKQLLEAGVHFGHQTRRWNPKMKSYIFGERNGVHIIDLQKTLKLFKEAVDFIAKASVQGKTILFVGTKSQAQEVIEDEAQRCGMYFITNRWLGGLLTNFVTVQNSIRRYRELETMSDDGYEKLSSKKEVARLERERKKLEKNLRGIKDMERCPDALFVVDSRQETIAIKEAAKLNIPIIAIVDTNCDPDLIDHVIPGNDDALRAIKLVTETIAGAVLEGRTRYEARVAAELKEAEAKAAKEAARREAAKEAAEAARAAAKEVAVAKEAASRAAKETAKETARDVSGSEKEEIVDAESRTVSGVSSVSKETSSQVATEGSGESAKKEVVKTKPKKSKTKKASAKKKVVAKASKKTAKKKIAAKTKKTAAKSS